MLDFFLYINMGTAFQLLDLIKIFKMAAELCKGVLLRFSAIFLFRNKARNAGRSRKNAGNKPNCGISRTIAGRLTDAI